MINRQIHILIFGFYFSVPSLHGQTSVFKSEIQKIFNHPDVVHSIAEETPGTTAFNFFDQDMSHLENLMYAHISMTSRREKYKIKKSDVLSQLAGASTLAWKGSQYADNEKWRGLSKHFKRAKLRLPTNFNLIESFSFTVPLINSKKKKFYYDKKTPKGDMYLFEGKKPNKSDEDQTQVPLAFYTETELIKLLSDELNKNKCIARIKKGSYRFVGLSIELNEKSLYKNQIPTARVVVFFGANRLQQIKIVKQ